MSRGGRGFGRGRGGGGGPGRDLPAGMTFKDLQEMPREATPLYPPLEPMPVLSKIKGKEREISREQVALALRLRNSAYYEMEDKKADELERYSDRFKPAAKTRPLLSQEILNKEFFPPTLWEAYFNPKKKATTGKSTGKRKRDAKIDWDGFEKGDNPQQDGEEGSQAGGDDDAVEEVEDYDEEDDNDYEANYFDNGEEDNDDLGDGGGGDDGGDDAFD